jgi:hypothetical protein
MHHLDPIHEDRLRNVIQNKHDNDFQNFINRLMHEKHDEDLISVRNSFVCIRQKRDKGNDGILDNETILAAYAPEGKPSLKAFSKKFEDDYLKYVNNWKEEYPRFCFVYNKEYTAGMIKIMNDVDMDIDKWDIESILKIIKNMYWTNIKNISRYLRLDEDYLKYDILKNVVEDMMEDDHVDNNPENKPPMYIEDKVKLNYEIEDIEEALGQYYLCVEYFNTLRKILSNYNDDEHAALKMKIMRQFAQYAGNFKTKFNYLVEYFVGKNKDDDEYTFNVIVVLTYYFERCTIGKKTSDG